MPRADLHVHSRHSDRPSEWVLRRIGAPECHTPPLVVYDTARRRGMDLVTVTDHNCIDGALEIAHLPGAFVSVEVTAYFPDDGCKVHVLVWDVTEAQFADIQRVREDIIQLRDYLVVNSIVHACAHPLYSVNDRLTSDHFEKLLLLFNTFETMNGGRNRRGNTLVDAVLRHLTSEHVEQMANRHNVAPVGDVPWLKGVTGGSDDHSGAFVAKGFTECPSGRTPAGFLSHVAARESRAGGLDGTPLSFAHSLYSIGYQYYRDRFLPPPARSLDVLQAAMGRVFGESARRSLRGRVTSIATRFTGRPSQARVDAAFWRTVSTEMQRLFGEDWLRDDFVASPEKYEELNRRTFALSSRVANQMLFELSCKLVERARTGSIFDCIEALSAMGPVLLGVAPYLFSFAHQARDKAFLGEVEARFLGPRPQPAARTAWFIDGPAEVNGITTLVGELCQQARAHGDQVVPISISSQAVSLPGAVQFTPVGSFPLPESDSINLDFPPFLDILDYCDREQFSEIIISTPGLAGLAALAAGRLLNIRLVGIYHTDLPQYVRSYTDDDAMESATWWYMRWFYDQLDAVYVPTEVYRRQLVAKGFTASKLWLLPHGTDTERFHPRRRWPGYWRRYGAGDGPVAIYVGRVAREKDLDVLADAWETVVRQRPGCRLAIVGDGPQLPWLRERLRHLDIIFTGFLFGDDLGAAYASADFLVFPSTTDTFGNVVLEAMASGLPVIVSDRGGPAEFVRHGITGLVARGRDHAALADAIETLFDDPARRRTMGDAARAEAERCTWRDVYRRFRQRTPGHASESLDELPPVTALAR